MTWIHKCVGIRYALKVQKLGADIVTVVGYENGGATGKLDIGTLVLVHLFPDDYARVIQRLTESPDSNHYQLEESIVGINSQQAGAWLTDRWHLPPGVVRVVAQSSLENPLHEVTAVSLAANLVRMREHLESALPDVPPQLIGLTQEMLATIEEQSRLQDEELRTIANLMVR